MAFFLTVEVSDYRQGKARQSGVVVGLGRAPSIKVDLYVQTGLVSYRTSSYPLPPSPSPQPPKASK